MEIITQAGVQGIDLQSMWAWALVFAGLAFCATFITMVWADGRFFVFQVFSSFGLAVVVGAFALMFSWMSHDNAATRQTQELASHSLMSCGYVGTEVGSYSWSGYLDKVKVVGEIDRIGDVQYILGENGCNE